MPPIRSITGAVISHPNPSAPMQFGQTPLHVACMRPGMRNDAFDLLCTAEVMDEPDNEGNTPLHAAVSHGNVDAVRLLLEHGMDTMCMVCRPCLHTYPLTHPPMQVDAKSMSRLTYSLALRRMWRSRSRPRACCVVTIEWLAY